MSLQQVNWTFFCWGLVHWKNFPQIMGRHWPNMWQIKNWIPWNHIITICWCNKCYFCAYEGLWQWSRRWPLQGLVMSSDDLCNGLEHFWHCKSTRICGNYTFLIIKRISLIFLWYNDTFIVACSRRVGCLWANSQQMDVFSGEDDEGFEGLCSFHGTAWRVNGWRLHVGRDIGIVIEYLHEFEHVSRRV